MKHGWKRGWIALAAFALVCVLLRVFVFHTVRIAGSSMSATLQDGDIVLVGDLDYAFGRSPERGDIVECVFPDRSGAYIKRVIGLPGEEITFRGGCLSIDGVPLAESYVSGETEDYEITLGEDEYFVLGDNRTESYDSRAEEIGVLHRKSFAGRVLFVLWHAAENG